LRTRVDLLLVDEAGRFRLRFACEDCSHFDDANELCNHEYPSEPRRADLKKDAVVFCKEFEIGGAS
jgi:hypothetical protein